MEKGDDLCSQMNNHSRSFHTVFFIWLFYDDVGSFPLHSPFVFPLGLRHLVSERREINPNRFSALYVGMFVYVRSPEISVILQLSSYQDEQTVFTEPASWNRPLVGDWR